MPFATGLPARAAREHEPDAARLTVTAGTVCSAGPAVAAVRNATGLPLPAVDEETHDAPGATAEEGASGGR